MDFAPRLPAHTLALPPRLPAEPERGLTIWIHPEQAGQPPSVEHGTFSLEEQRNAWQVVASREGREGSLVVHQDVDIYHMLLAPSHVVHQALGPGRGSWVQVVTGMLWANDLLLSAGDAVETEGEPHLVFTADERADVVHLDPA